MSKTKTIEFEGFKIYPTKPNGIWQLEVYLDRVYIGQISSKCRCSSAQEACTPERLKVILEKLLDRPSAKKRLKEGRVKNSKKGSLQACLHKVLTERGRRYNSAGSKSSLKSAVHFIARSLGPKITGLHIKKITRRQYFIVRTQLRKEKPGTEYGLAGWLARVTKELLKCGLSHDCKDTFDQFESGTQTEAAGEAFTYHDLSDMLEKLPQQNFTVQFLFWLGYSGGPDLFEAAIMERKTVNPETGMVTLDPDGTVSSADFKLVKDGLQCFLNQSFEDGEIYLFPDLIYTPEECATPDYRKTRVDLKDGTRKKRIRSAVDALWNAFMAEANITSKEKSFSSARKEVIAYMTSMNVKGSVIEKMLGVTPRSAQRYTFPAEWELSCVRDIRERHLKAIASGEEESYVISKTQVLAELQSFVNEYRNSIEQAASQGHRQLKATLELAIVRVSSRVREELAAHRHKDQKRVCDLSANLDSALKEAENLKEWLIDIRAEVGAECGVEECMPNGTGAPSAQPVTAAIPPQPDDYFATLFPAPTALEDSKEPQIIETLS